MPAPTVTEQLTPRQRLVSDFENLIRLAHLAFGGDIARLLDWAENVSPEEVACLEDAAFTPAMVSFIRVINGSDFTDVKKDSK
jgi:hypothetical protein